jgi:hypothetical protein
MSHVIISPRPIHGYLISRPHVSIHAKADPSGPSVIQPLSQPAWGWSGNRMKIKFLKAVVPTCVGMVRTCPPPSRCPGSCPHPRADGLALIVREDAEKVDIPTRVGRDNERLPNRPRPHAGGDNCFRGPPFISHSGPMTKRKCT